MIYEGEGGRKTHLVVPEPDFVVEDGEGEDVVDERLRFARCWGYAEYLSATYHSARSSHNKADK